MALKNFAKYFLHQSHEEREHAEKLMKLQNQRGGRIFLQDIKVSGEGLDVRDSRGPSLPSMCSYGWGSLPLCVSGPLYANVGTESARTVKQQL